MTWFERMAEHAEPDQARAASPIFLTWPKATAEVSYNSVLHSCARSEKPRTDEVQSPG